MIRKNIVIFISGEGTNMLSLIQETKKNDYPAKIIGVFSDNPHAQGLVKARQEKIQTYSIPYKDCISRQEHEKKILTHLSSIQPDFICLAGYMRLLSKNFVESYKDKIINIHPSLLPLFPGLHTHRRILQSGIKITGCTVHMVTQNMDEGPIIAQAAVPVSSNDTEESLSQKVLSVEHILYPLAIKSMITGEKYTFNNHHIIGIG
ncbi:phosphoribosylglycinamide formyltransferase [Candidatus Liberibacter africanus]|uniref:Phosphoribosylglycinamide formyltransferase n=1 Tax=Candidatus Liberibacter africanus PTSAPSY TaxID=1277257 RepID=A0A0G3I4X9_LIBAF|nr:phosphoribosylglycinamide formyltransferase [Candidatus Liberibacter africanus]AKK20335.1 phosphoribosylglycinamide formyltransferase [Candidatus Liberibacter africanus PTSAPSY]QTP64084.1 phosphoribosylglycinamide formyltransferase [Candidatus Liberibacter africanus]